MMAHHPADHLQIIIADDHEFVRKGIRETLQRNPEWEIVAEAANGRQAVDLCSELRPAVVVLDLDMPEVNVLEAIRQILGVSPKSRVLVLTLHDTESHIKDVLKAGAKGYVLKSDAARDLITAVQSVAEGRPFFTAKVSEVLLSRYLGSGTPQSLPNEKLTLTAREREIVRLIVDGKSNKEVATTLNISVRTVETHRSNIMEKLGTHSVSELILYAIQNGLKDVNHPSST